MKFERYKENPILKPIKDNKWESKAVFNCGAVYSDGKVHLLYRAIGEYENYISRIGYAVSEDGVNFERKNSAIFEPIEKYGEWACEDPRITKIKDKYYITYVIPHKEKEICRTALATTTDFINFKREGVITPKNADDKDVVLFPEKINGKYAMLHRPHNWIKKETYEERGKLYLKLKGRSLEWSLKEKPVFPEKPSIWIAYSNDFKDWFGHQVIIEPQEEWEAIKIGAGPPPIKTEEGWLLIYHGVSYENRNKKYKAGAALLDLRDPSKIIARAKEPILEPQESYEIFGDVPNVVFPEGMVVVNEKLFLYYGAADKACCLATCKLNEIKF